jgi:hypothetical protein
MTVFAVLMPTPQPGLVSVIEQEFPGNHILLNETQYLVSYSGTAKELVAKLRIYDAKLPAAPPSGLAVVLSVSSYFGRAPSTVWEWIKVKMESPAIG